MTTNATPQGELRPMPDFVRDLPRRAFDWLQCLRSDERFGLFRVAPNAFIPFDLQASSKALGQLAKLGRLQDVPGYSEASVAETVAYLQGLQDPETGLFRDEYLDPLAEATYRDPDRMRVYREGLCKWGEIALKHLGATPLYPWSRTGKGGEPDGSEVVRRVRAGDWSHPWGIGSNAAQWVRELFQYACRGREDFLPAVAESMEFVLTHQDPDTGMWGGPDVPLFERISGTLKVVSIWRFHLGFRFPHMQRLADSCIAHHADGGFYADTDNCCIPRNVAELVVICLLDTDHRRDELLDTLADLTRHQHENFGTPDGGYAHEHSGKAPLSWNGIRVAEASDVLRGDLQGLNAELWSTGLIAETLGWRVPGLSSPQEDAPARIAALPFRPVLTGGHIEFRAHASG